MKRLPTDDKRSARWRWWHVPTRVVYATKRIGQRVYLGAQATPALLRALPAGRPWFVIRARLLLPDSRDWLLRRSLAQRIMDNQPIQPNGSSAQESQLGAEHTSSFTSESTNDGASSQAARQTELAVEAQQAGQPVGTPPRVRHVLLVRHGQSQYNVEGRLPGQLPGVALTDEGRRQAHQAAVALSGLPLSAIIASPLERARDTAEIIARGWALPVREDARLMDTDVGPWAGQTINDVSKNDPRWKVFVEHPTEPPAGVESLAAVQERSVAAVEDALNDPTTGDYIVIVAHADVVKLIIMRYTNVPIDGVRFVSISNASISALAFTEFTKTEAAQEAAQENSPWGQDGATAEATEKRADIVRSQPTVLAVNWTSVPRWLTPPPKPKAPDAAPATTDAANNGAQANHASHALANTTDQSSNPSGDTEGYLLPEPSR